MESLMFLWFISLFYRTVGTTPEGCDKGWKYFRQLCYRYNPHTLDAIAAKDICSTQGSTLSSVWDDEEKHFLTSTLLPPMEQNLVWIGLVPRPNKDKGWVWLDSSKADIHTDGNTPKFNTDICGAMNREGGIILKNCWDTLPGFICKKSLQMTYTISDLYNASIDTDPAKVLFERVWPPKLQDFPQYTKQIAHVKVSYVSHETDCAYYCSHVTSCQAFTIRCSLPWKCKQYACDLYQSKS